MGPKVEAVCRFVELTGDTAAIGRLEDAAEIVYGRAGTVVTPAATTADPTTSPSRNAATNGSPASDRGMTMRRTSAQQSSTGSTRQKR